MIADLKPYPEYKETDSPWLGRMPAHWKLPRLGSVLRERGETNEHQKVTQVLSVLKDVGVIRYEEKGNIGNKKSEDIGRYKIVRPDDIVVNCMNVIIGSVGRSRYTGCLSPVYYVLTRRSGDDNPRYVAAIFSAKPFHKSLVRIGNGILAHRMRIPMELLKCEPFPVPPPAEQAAIVRFLDWANGRLERTIRAKRKVIALLTEQKQAIIHRAVTRGLPAEAAAKAGLDTDVPLKPSGIPWLGDIPTHWVVRKMKFLVSAVGGMTPNKGIARFWDGRVPWVSPKDMKVREIADSQNHITEAAFRETNISLIQPPAVLIVVRGMILARTFPTAVTKVSVTVNQDMKALIPKPELNTDFLVSLLTGIQRELLTLVEEAGHGTRCLRTDSWANFLIPLPPFPEQLRINEQLKSETAGVNTAINRLEREIELLREYRTRLVADVVTGKLDVREAAARLPEEAAAETAEDVADGSDESELSDDEAAV